MSKLPYLVQEVNAALEVYLSGRTGQQFNRTAFILCDDGTEIASKLFLIEDNPGWSDGKQGGGFKSYLTVMGEVLAVFHAKRTPDVATVDALRARMLARRQRRNETFHTTKLLDMNFHARDCVEALCDLLDYGRVLFPPDPAIPGSGWEATVAATGSMETCEAIVRLDRKSYGDPGVGPKVNALLGGWPRATRDAKRKGCEVAHHAEDMHLRMAITNGGKLLRDRLRTLL